MKWLILQIFVRQDFQQKEKYIFTCTELTSDTKEEDTFEDTFERFFERELQEGDYGYALKPGEQSLRFADLKDELFFADKDSELYVYMTDSVIVSGIKNPVKSLDKSANDVSNKIVKREGLPSLLFYVVDDSYRPPVSEEVSLSEMNVIGIYSSNEYYSLTDDKAWGDK